MPRRATRALARTQRRAPTGAEAILRRSACCASQNLLLGGSGNLVLDGIRQAVDPSSDLR